MKTAAFDFDLPETCIALRPAKPRDSARMLQVSGQGGISDHIVTDLPGILRAGDVLVINDTKVLPAALKAVRPARAHGGGGDVTVDINLLSHEGNEEWLAFARPAKRLRVNDELKFSPSVTARVANKDDGGKVNLCFNLVDDALLSAIEDIGMPPLPPYIARKRAPDSSDFDDYQTLFARDTGSVAAPTAGLHFTPELLEALEAKGVSIERVTLHVGAGTFLPVKTDDIDEHVMHSEWYSISPEVAGRLDKAKNEGRRIIAVGTTSLRTLESAAFNGRIGTQCDDTDIFITPGYRFQIVDGLMTNFHLPKSTLFMLVSALSGLDTMQAAYKHAIETGYRFYSYGDASLLWKAA